MRCFPFANDIGKLLTINSQRAATLAFPLQSAPRLLTSSQSAPSNLESLQNSLRCYPHPSTETSTPDQSLRSPPHLRRQSEADFRHYAPVRSALRRTSPINIVDSTSFTSAPHLVSCSQPPSEPLTSLHVQSRSNSSGFEQTYKHGVNQDSGIRYHNGWARE
jgi:hypothetical protein